MSIWFHSIVHNKQNAFAGRAGRNWSKLRATELQSRLKPAVLWTRTKLKPNPNSRISDEVRNHRPLTPGRNRFAICTDNRPVVTSSVYIKRSINKRIKEQQISHVTPRWLLVLVRKPHP
ncbi:hypothetical protein RRG08_055294 [Elysia crispata]|uniref:Uncharacterized protein n=1 Tax=Elysia crispata TaxID=231223 RepID=A0AAE0Z1R4_9GAST|nr:hypothetical protein RRG08_055294 [Elysia crispata]